MQYTPDLYIPVVINSVSSHQKTLFLSPLANSSLSHSHTSLSLLCTRLTVTIWRDSFSKSVSNLRDIDLDSIMVAGIDEDVLDRCRRHLKGSIETVFSLGEGTCPTSTLVPCHSRDQAMARI
eukprot:TRINITY_DN5470_c0_g2_i1.p1 TRINITY_DN5470_c0_g2~~TRINITY_DN5470_c0_g2_i1.p1  ORF type:complete len:122 (-),score=5.85 TRINITY_DN5470_c0_g2_i1:185-550(-)